MSGIASGTAGAEPAPSLAQVSAKLDDLAHQSEQLSEQYNRANADLAAKQQAAAQAKRAEDLAVAAYANARTQLSQTIAANYEARSSLGPTSALLTSSDGQAYVDTLNILDIISAHRSDVLGQLDQQKRAADAATLKADVLVAQAVNTLNAVNTMRSEVERSTEQYQAMFAQLSEAQRIAYQNRYTVPTETLQAAVSSFQVVGVPLQARIAVQFALAQVGKPYVFAAAGPDTYDCSGLTMAAYGAAGIALPHFAEWQYNYGQHVPAGQPLRPGDLMFFYRPIDHVTIYIGNGLMVSAPQPGENVKVMPANAFGRDYVGATRLVS